MGSEKPSNKDINQTIARFMGVNAEWSEKANAFMLNPLIDYSSSQYNYWSYSSSLDVLVPVWERLQTGRIEILKTVDGFFCQINRNHYYEEDKRETIPEAAALATCKEIKRTEEQDNG